MRAARILTTVDSHTAGMPTRVVTGGVGAVPGETMAQRRAHAIAELDGLRRFLMLEPHGHSAMSGAVLQPPTRPEADVGVLFMEVTGWLPMCGHGTIGVVTTLVETGMVTVTEPETVVTLDTPAGLVRARVEVKDGRATAVTLRNVPAFLHASDCSLQVGDATVTYDMAYGGNFYALVDAERVRIDARRDPEAGLRFGLDLMREIDAHACPVHPTDPSIAGCHHVVLHSPGAAGADAVSATVISPGYYDRSPCGTGTSARMAQLHAHGQLELGAPFVNESLIGTRFTGRLVDHTDLNGIAAVLPEITGSAYITAMAQHVLDPDDPFPTGFQIGG